MTVCSSSKPGSAPPKTSQNPTAITETWRANNREQIKAIQKEKVIKDEITKVLNADREAIKSVKKSVPKRYDFDSLDKSEQDRQMMEAVLRCVKQRIGDGKYVSCKYPEFTDFIPQFAFGVKRSVDPMKAECMSRQIAALRKESVGQQNSDDDDDDGEDIPHCKNERDGIKQKMSDIPLYNERNKSTPSGHSPDKDSSSHKKPNTATQRTHDRLAAFHGLKRKRADQKDGEIGNKRKVITWRAVSRGQPLFTSSLAPKSKQPGPTRNPWFGRVVSRGQITTEDVKDVKTED